MREREYLRERYRALMGYTATLITVIGVIYLLPLLVILFYRDEVRYAPVFLLLGLPLVLVGRVIRLRLLPHPENSNVTVHEGAVIVSLVWIFGIITATVPLMIISGLGFNLAIFEATSAWTTTGLSVVDVESAPAVLLFFRSLLQLAGGAGLAIIALSAVLGPVGYGLSVAEGRSDQLAPQVRQSANLVLRLYGSFVVVGVLALVVAGMGWFDAINHAFAALSTGGFSTRAASIGYWDSPRVEAVIILLMLLGSTNFMITYTLVRGNWRAALRNGELRFMLLVILVTFVLLLTLVTQHVYPTFDQAVRVAIFESVSAISGTGFSTVDYHAWHDFGWLMLVVVMLVGGGTGSTSGGIKQLRILILFRAIEWEVRRAFLPPHAVNEPQIWQGDRNRPLTDQQVRQVALFIGLYGFLFLFGSGVMAAHGYDLRESLFEFASSVGTAGLSVGITATDMPAGVLWTQVLAMLLGRLEFFTVIIGLTKLAIDIPVMTQKLPTD